MSAYAEYLKNLLFPLGVYTLEKGSISEGAVCAMGEALDQVQAKLDAAQKEALIATAEEEGLRRREKLFARRPVAVTPESRRAAVTALLQIDDDSLTPAAINRTLLGCGIRAEAQETQSGCLRVVFPDVGGIPEGFEELREIILDILPCHLEVEFYFRYLTWEKCEAMGLTWAQTEGAQHTWHSFELLV